MVSPCFVALPGCFNNLTKSLSFSLYKLHYLNNKQAHQDYNAYISKLFCAENLNIVLTQICHAIGGNVLNVAQQDYQPQGASVTLMISEEAQPLSSVEILVAHLDKSHLCIHTYPEESPQDGVAIFRTDVELSTCGVISPLKVLNYVIEDFDADVVDIDYRIRGMTRDLDGKKQFNDQLIDNISDYISAGLKENYQIENTNLAQKNLFHTKLSRKKITLNKYIFAADSNNLATEEQIIIRNKLMEEIQHLFKNSA